MPHAMTRSEIAELVEAFADGAARARDGGCDGVELHGAQGHLIMQFVSPFSNRRDDEYGGSVANRLRFPLQIMRRIRAKAGRDFILGYRLGVEEFTPGGLAIADVVGFTPLLLEEGLVDFLSLTQGNFNSLDSHCPDSHYAPLAFIDLQAQVKAVAGKVPVVSTARVQTPEQAESILASGKADLVGMCRAIVADPEWALKAREGRGDDIRRCIFTCACWGSGKRLSCSVNPTVGQELDMPALEPAQKRRRVVVVGGGAAGMEAAWVASQRGHTVILFEARPELGGKLVGSERFMPWHEVWQAVDFARRQVAKSNVTLRLGESADVAAIRSLNPDAVILASGAKVGLPELPGDGSVSVHAFDASVPDDLPDGHWVVMDADGYYWASALTEYLARQGRKVTYVTRFAQPLREVPEVARMSTLRTFDRLGVTVLDNTSIVRAELGSLVFSRYYNADHEARLEGVRGLIWVGIQHVEDRLAQPLREAGFASVHVVGDAKAPRRLAHALGEAHRAAREI
jgi:thioredoxin reductase